MRYTELRKLGEGAFGLVVLAKDTLTGELVAAKKVRLRYDCKFAGSLFHLLLINTFTLRHYGDERANAFRKGADAEDKVLPIQILREIKGQ